jgi:hypothetical protein
MPNPLRGETTFEANGKEYRVRFNWNVAAEYELPAGRPLSVGVQEILDGKVSARSLRAMLWAGLQENHPEVSLKHAGEMLGAIGVKKGLDVMLEAVQYFYPAPDKDAPPDPPTAPVSPTPAP